MSLAVDNIGLSQQDETAVHNIWDTVDTAELELTIMGFAPMEKPDFRAPEIDGELYKALNRGDGQMLTFKHMQFAAWYSYAKSRIGQIEGRVLQIDNEMKDVRRRLREKIVSEGDKKPTNEQIENRACLNPRYLELAVESQKFRQMIEQLEAHASKYSAGKSLTSRVVEIRRQELEGLSGGRAYRRDTRNDE